MNTSALPYLAFLCVALALPATASAQGRIPADPDPTRLANAPQSAEPEDDWQLEIGAGGFYGPAFLGSKDYQLQVGPMVEVRYKDRFFLSVIDGVGFDLIKTDNFRAGPILNFEQKRQEDGKGNFVIAGGSTTALRGLGDVAATFEAGGYLEYQSGGFSVKGEVRMGVNGHEGLIAELGARYSTGLMGMTVGDQPVVFSLGPRATVVDDKYNQAYFGIDADQSARSGLAQFNAKGGLQSYGAGATLAVPITGGLGVAVMAGFDRLSGDAGKSPLVRERGSRNQATIGLGIIYRFGL
jgi:outer membrane protein